MTIPTLTPDSLDQIDAYWRAANYLSVGQIYLLDNPLLREPLALERTSSRGCSATGAPRRA
jgi:xylulose-5-phosphate/fructose-6-phosphate phosphoketolase